MPHDLDGMVHWHEPKRGERAGFGKFGQPLSDYDKFMESEGIPIFRGIGVRTVRDLELADWPRMGGRGSYIQLQGTEGKWGQYVVEVPGAGALNVEKHLYEEIYLVAEGRGTTEVWMEEGGKKHVFEWQKGSLFSIPVNAYHRIVNATAEPALLIGAPRTRPTEPDRRQRFPLQLPQHLPEPVLGVRGFLQVQRGSGARPDPRAGDAAHQSCARRHQLRPAAGQPPVARLAPGGTLHDRQQVLPVAWPARDRQVFQGPRPYLCGRADLHKGQGLYLYMARALRREPVEGRTRRPGPARRLRAVRHGHCRPRRRPLVSPALQLFRRAFPPDSVVRAEPSDHRHGPAARTEADRLYRDGRDRGGTSIPYWMEDPKLRAEFEAHIASNGGSTRMDPSLYDKPEDT